MTQPRLGIQGWLRWTWRQLTSMRTALFLLLLLAIGAIPGSTFPQRSIDPARTAQWIADHPAAGPVLDRLGFFEVYASPWFAAIYLLLFVSLIGCVLPRTRILWHQVRAAPPRAPRRLDRLAAHRETVVEGDPGRCASCCGPRCADAATGCTPTTTTPSPPRRATCARRATSSSTSRSSACSSASPGATCSAGRVTSSCPSGRPSPTRCRATTPSARARGSTSTPWSRTRSPSNGSTSSSRPTPRARGSSGRPATSRRRRPSPMPRAAPRSAPSGSTSPSRPATARSSSSGTATPRGSRCVMPTAPCCTPTRHRSFRRTTTTPPSGR